jgi:hypothetical protein
LSTETIVLAESSYSISEGTQARTELKLTSMGTKLLTDVKAHPVREDLVVTVHGGTSTTMAISIS